MGETCFIRLTRNPPDFAILDIKMPRLDGEELLKKLEKNVNSNNFFNFGDEEVDELLGLKTWSR